MADNGGSHGTPGLVARWRTWAPQFQSLLRIVAAIIFITSGTMKLFGYPPAPNAMSFPLVSEVGVAGVLEAFGGALLLAGFCTRPTAFILSGEMAVAYFQYHASQGFWPLQNGGVGAAIYCFVWLYFSAAGAGPWSIDERRRNAGRENI